jgi:CCR4-NOT transcription complex subunit 6
MQSMQIYPYTPAWALPWNFRKRNLLREVLAYKADIMALQVTLSY